LTLKILSVILNISKEREENKMKKWNDIYNNEEELIKDMLKAKADERKYRYGVLVKGYTYIHSFQNYYKKNGKLTPKQMTQLKRLAYEIYKNTHWDMYR
jgi:hypothetical protein